MSDPMVEILEGQLLPAIDQPIPRRPRTEAVQIVPGWLQSVPAARSAIVWAARHYGRHALFHLVRLPWYVLLLLWRAPVGVMRCIVRLLLWMIDAEARDSYRDATSVAGRENPSTYLRIRQDRAHRIQARALTAGIITAAVIAALLLGRWMLGNGVLVAAAALAVVLLGVAGRPAGSPILSRPVDPSMTPRLTSDLIVTALGALGIAEINKALTPAGEGIRFPAPITRDGAGWRADIDLPAGVTAGDVINRRDRLASGLRRPLDCVWPENDPHQHAGRLQLWVADKPLSASKPKPWPHANARRLSLFDPFVIGWDPRGREISTTLMYVSAIVGAQPRMGKSFTLRLLLLAAALDPRAELHIYDLKGGADFLPFEPIAEHLRVGDEPADIAALVQDLRERQADMRTRYKTLRALPRDECPEGKTTDNLASRGIGLHPVLIVLDECQLAYADPNHGKDITALVEDLARRGPAAGIVLISATQRPDAKSLPTGIAANAAWRYCLRVQGQVENDMVLGTSSYQAGVRATMFSRDDKGVGYLSGEGDDPVIVRAAYLDATTAEKIVAKALTYRAPKPAELPDDTDGVLDHLLEVWPAGELAVWCETLADLLADAYPVLYDGWGAVQVSAAVRPHVATVQVKRDGANRRGLRFPDVSEAARNRGAREVAA